MELKKVKIFQMRTTIQVSKMQDEISKDLQLECLNPKTTEVKINQQIVVRNKRPSIKRVK